MKFSVIKKGNKKLANKLSELFYEDEINVLSWEDVVKVGNSSSYLIVLEHENEGAVGCAVVQHSPFFKSSPDEQLVDGENVVFITRMQIAEKYQGEGYGRALFQYIADSTEHPILVQSISSSYSFWRNMGFEPLEEDSDDEESWLFMKKEMELKKVVRAG